MSQKPNISFIILADSHKEIEKGKIDAQGIFTNIGVFGLPASREFSLITGISEIPKGEFEVEIFIESPSDKPVKLGSLSLDVDQKIPDLVNAERVNVTFTETGSHKFLANVKNSNNTGYIKFEVHKKKWPEPLSDEEIKEALENENTITAARAVVTCDECKEKYTFEVKLDPNESISEEAHSFPKDGEFECPSCGNIIELRDIEGQVRSQLAKKAG